jgi:predicted nucleic acid-binding protein
VEVPGFVTHPEDDLILATAVASRSTFLVTGDRKLRAVGIFQCVTIPSPREFLVVLEGD